MRLTEKIQNTMETANCLNSMFATLIAGTGGPTPAQQDLRIGLPINFPSTIFRASIFNVHHCLEEYLKKQESTVCKIRTHHRMFCVTSLRLLKFKSLKFRTNLVLFKYPQAYCCSLYLEFTNQKRSEQSFFSVILNLSYKQGIRS